VKRGKRFILKSMMHTFHGITRDTSTASAEWQKLGITDLLRRLNELVREMDEDLRILALLTWANVVSEEEIERHDFSKFSLPQVIGENLDKVVRAIVTKESLFRIKIYMEDMTSEEAACVIVDTENLNFEYTVVDIVEALYKVSMNDSVKSRVYKDMNMKVNLRGIILHGNKCEQEHAAKLLWQLCFDETVMKDVGEDKELFGFINSVLKGGQENEALKRNLKGVLWMRDKLEKKNAGGGRGVKKLLRRGESVNKSQHNFKKVVDKVKAQKSVDYHELPLSDASSEEKTTIHAERHVMISYNFASRDLCLNIKRELERMGHAVWIDVEAISGSSLESMANAVENAKCVLICKFFYFCFIQNGKLL
jgi:hypothetical protein